jgi:hypothetical protein
MLVGDYVLLRNFGPYGVIHVYDVPELNNMPSPLVSLHDSYRPLVYFYFHRMNNSIFKTASFSATEMKAKLNKTYGGVKVTFHGFLT